MTTERAAAPPQVRTAGALVAVQGLAAVVFAIVIALQASSAALPVGTVLGEAAAFAVLGAAVVAIGLALVAGRRGARTPAIVVQLLLLPVVYSLIGPSQQLVLGILCGLYVVATFLLLISEPSRAWAMGVEDDAR
ncbi:hypothetical protein [Pseudonocardia sp.]|uniref:hypothetical protein n=1 Tax=Pseudonocardia sp. TaxID=60912 RepID=UPI00262DD5FC|nr:hypothetical protein [Pseudonocardia sp.]MCW2720498.1 hypothetical protein [Pseudonocardia sp.]MDT7618437.1 hypothetical protein [Pseudonocardiales bacterium]